MRALRDRYTDDARAVALRAALDGDQELVIGACHGGFPVVLLAATLASRQAARGRSAGAAPCIIAHDAGPLAEDLEELGLRVAVLPELDRFREDSENDPTHARRSAALEAFAQGAALIATPTAAQQRVPDLAEVARTSIVVRPGDEPGLTALTERLVAAGYHVASVAEAPGQIAVRGGILDIYPWIGTDALRLEFFGDQVESVRRFDPFTQESVSKADEAVLAAGGGGLADAVLWQQLPAGPIVVLGDVPLRNRLDKDHGRREVRLARQLEQGALDGATTSVDRLRGDLRRSLSELAKLLEETKGNALLMARSDEAKKELSAHCGDHGLAATVDLGRIGAGFRDAETGLIAVHDFELAERAPARRRASKVGGGTPLSSLTDLKRGDHVVHLRHGIGVFRGMATLEQRGFMEDFLLLEFAGGTRMYVPTDAIDLVQKYVGATGRAPTLSTVGGESWKKQRAKAEKAIADISADLLRTHVARIAAGGIAFPADDKRVRAFDAAFAYEETEDQLAAAREIKADMERGVAMDRLLCGDVGFGKTEVAMRAAVKAVTAGKQVAVLAPTTLLAEQHLETFTERFRAVEGITVAGLNRFRTPKERTAVLERAAAGEVQILVGTHALLTDKLSFADLGLLVIDEEHRFGVKAKEKLKALRGSGGKPPDVLSLSATPIPRTLHFSLVGIRDISVLAEAPAERMAVDTRVAPWDEELVKEAVDRERERQGQIFVVAPRIEDLDKLCYKIGQLSPGVRIDAIHGQMDEERIGRVMDAFRRHDLDCLVSTSIVESGIDIPNANTLMVCDAQRFGLAELHQLRGRIGRFTRQAYALFLVPKHREVGEEARERLNAIQEYAQLGAGFKLAMRDLELRGAGNLLGAEQSGHIDAIGYELYAKLLADAVARAKAQAEAQTPTPAAPAAKRAGPLSHEDGATLGMQVDAYVPDDWLEATQLKFELYKLLDGARKPSDLANVARTARDRYGALPDPVVRLFQVRAIRLRLAEIGVGRIEVGDRRIRLHLSGALPKELAAVKLPELIHIQLDGPVLVLFLKPELTQDVALGILCRLLGLDLAFLGRGF